MLVLGASSFYPRYFPAAMRDHFDMVFCDLRQWAPTPPGFDIGSLTLDCFTDDVEAIRDALELDRPIVVGQSQHGAIAIEYARRFPDQVRGVIAVAPYAPSSGREGQPTGEEFFARDASPERQAAHATNKRERRTVDNAVTSDDFIANYVSGDAQGWYDFTYNCAGLWDGVEINVPVMNQLFGPDGLGGFEIGNDRVPTFLALGRHDYFCPHVHWDVSHQKLSPLTYRLYERSGHHPPFEQPAEFTADVVGWASLR